MWARVPGRKEQAETQDAISMNKHHETNDCNALHDFANESGSAFRASTPRPLAAPDALQDSCHAEVLRSYADAVK